MSYYLFDENYKDNLVKIQKYYVLLKCYLHQLKFKLEPIVIS